MKISTMAGLLLLIFSINISASTITGTIYDYDTNEIIDRATIRVEGTGRATLSNDNGVYRINPGPGYHKLKISHIAHYSEYIELDLPVSDTLITVDIRLRPSMLILKPMKVYERKYDPAQKIIVEAIRHKEDILSKLSDYSFEAYVRMVISDRNKPDTTDILLIGESTIKYSWEKPDKYKEIITGRKQTANVEAEDILISVGGILNLNLNRINIDDYSIVSPTAKDALDHYNYYLLDTIYVDSAAIFRLEIEPQSKTDPLFVGEIWIADSTYDVVGVDVGFNEAFSLPFLDSLRFGQTFAEFEDEYWMPVEQRISGNVDINFPGIPEMKIDYFASIDNYSFEQGFGDDFFDEYVLEVAETADDFDSLAWVSLQSVPLSAKEIEAYKRIDSVENIPEPLYKNALKIIPMTLGIMIAGYDFFHFNRVEGPFVGIGLKSDDLFNNLDLSVKTGYSFDLERWRHKYGFDYQLSEKPLMSVGFEYRDEVSHRPTIISRAGSNITMHSILLKHDPFDYYIDKGFQLRAMVKPFRNIWLRGSFDNFKQSSVTVNSEYSIFDEDDPARVNPAIRDGQLRSLRAEIEYDSRKMMKNKGKIRRLGAAVYTTIKAGVEFADPDLIDNDYDFTRYYFSFKRHQRTFGLGITQIYIYGGISRGLTPPQRLFNVDFGGLSNRVDLLTTGEHIFSGTKAALIHIDHEFGDKLFRKSGLPLIKKIPLSLSVLGTIFWTDLQDGYFPDDYDGLRLARNPYQEIGFGIRGLLPLNLRAKFIWQLSDYRTLDFAFGISTGF